MKLISFSLFGDRPHYATGAIENARLSPEIYPGWTCRFYVDRQQTINDELIGLGAEVIVMQDPPAGSFAMTWRFIPVADGSIERVIMRDTDSRINVREAAAVMEWEQSGLPFHTMHDHDHHRAYPVFAGMWGAKGGSLPKMVQWIRQWPTWRARLDDMLLLRQHAWPAMMGKTLTHSSVQIDWPSQPFPKHAPYDGYVGQQQGL